MYILFEYWENENIPLICLSVNPKKVSIARVTPFLDRAPSTHYIPANPDYAKHALYPRELLMQLSTIKHNTKFQITIPRPLE